jgi:adenine phosphoribosyltransferase
MSRIDLKSYIRSIPNFPKPGIMFRDITPLLSAPEALKASMDQLAEKFDGLKIDKIMAAEARGFLFATPLAIHLNVGFIPVRKPGKLPFDTESFHYELEYGNDCLQMHTDALKPGEKVLIVDDLLATGGTMKACINLAERSKAEVVGCAFLIELGFLPGRKILDGYNVQSLIEYHSED